MRANLVVNTHRPDAIEAARATACLLLGRGILVGSDASVAPSLDVPSLPTPAIAEADLVVAFGGDGTLIRAAHLCSELGTPILGVHYGRFGFVTQCRPDELPSALATFFAGGSRLERRMMLHTELRRPRPDGDPTILATLHTLNESVLQRAVTDRMLTFEVEVDRHLLTAYPADGVMVSTPTGSTGYSLSAGGPVLDPSLQVMLVTAIAPHTLSARPLVLSPDSTVILRLRTEDGVRGDTVLSGDAQTRLHLLGGEEVVVRRSSRTTNLVAAHDDDFLSKLGRRLLWSRGLMGQNDD